MFVKNPVFPMFSHHEHDHDHYIVLGLPFPEPGKQVASQQEIRSAYRRALLLNHPDKSQLLGSLQAKPTRYTIDEITKAYMRLSDPSRRHQNSEQAKQDLPGKFNTGNRHPYLGIETLDLDELDYDGDKNEWNCSCRCRDPRGFRVTEAELQSNGDCGEVILLCSGCSLRLRVTFAIAGDA